jgi:hypothetical protein
MTDIKNVRMAVLIERSSLGTREGRLRRSTVPSSTGRAIARAASTGRYVTAATAARHPRTTITDRRTTPGAEPQKSPKG